MREPGDASKAERTSASHGALSPVANVELAAELMPSLRAAGFGVIGPEWFGWLPVGFFPALKQAPVAFPKYRYANSLDGDCGDTLSIPLPASFEKVRVSVTNSGDCIVTVKILDPSQTKPDDKVKGTGKAEPGKNCNPDGNNASQVEFTCESKAGSKCKFTFDITSP